MRIATTGIIVNQFGQILLIKRDDTRTWAAPGGMLEAGELPTEGVAREVEEETGLKTLPVRLVGLDFWSYRGGLLMLTFRCLVRGGEIRPSPESPEVAYASADPLPRPILSVHRRRIESALKHRGGPPDWGLGGGSGLDLLRLGLSPIRALFLALQRRLQGHAPYQPPPPWDIGAFGLIRDEQERILWVKRTDMDAWNLPGGRGEPGETPWETAVREVQEETGLQVRLTDLTGVYVKSEQRIIFNWEAEVLGGKLQTGPESAEFAYFAPGEEPPSALPKQVERVQDAEGDGPVVFRRQGE